jgi:hypothetical protein
MSGRGIASRRVVFLLSVTATLAFFLAIGAGGGMAGTGATPLTDEVLVGGAGVGASGGIVTTAAHCNANRTSWFTYSATGSAEGPYPGTFTETGKVVISAQVAPGIPGVTADNLGIGQVTEITAHFEITSPNGTVSGVIYPPTNPLSSYLYGQPFEGGFCVPNGSSVTTGTALHAYDAAANVQYNAVIRTPTGQVTQDGGPTNVIPNDEAGTTYSGVSPGPINFLYEDFGLPS